MYTHAQWTDLDTLLLLETPSRAVHMPSGPAKVSQEGGVSCPRSPHLGGVEGFLSHSTKLLMEERVFTIRTEIPVVFNRNTIFFSINTQMKGWDTYCSCIPASPGLCCALVGGGEGLGPPLHAWSRKTTEDLILTSHVPNSQGFSTFLLVFVRMNMGPLIACLLISRGITGKIVPTGSYPLGNQMKTVNSKPALPRTSS